MSEPRNPCDSGQIPHNSFIARWQASGAAERANYQLFLSELCDLLGVPRPDPTRSDDRDNAYVFERSVTFQHGNGLTSTGRIDLYKRGCFVLEAKQGSDRQIPSDPPLAKEGESEASGGFQPGLPGPKPSPNRPRPSAPP